MSNAALLASLIVLVLASCAAPPPGPTSTRLQPASTSERSTLLAHRDHEPARLVDNDDHATVYVGVGSAYSPQTPLLFGSMDFQIDENLTIGPALHLGADDNSSIFATFGQLRYWFGKESDQHQFLPYLQAGLGLVYMDRDGHGSGTDLVINCGGGVRLLTGDGYRIGTNLLYNSVPGEVADDDSYFTWEIIHFSFD